MIVEQRTYTFKVGTVPEFLALYERNGLTLQRKILGNLIGYFSSEIGTLNQVVHLWGFDSLDDRARRRGELMANSEWLAFFSTVAPLLQDQQSTILKAASFSPIK